jgi:hypothetical protein
MVVASDLRIYQLKDPLIPWSVCCVGFSFLFPIDYFNDASTIEIIASDVKMIDE